jgi:urease accessory protein
LLIGSSLSSVALLDRVGKDGALRLAFERRDGRTVLTERRYSLPLQVLEPISVDGDGSLLVMLLNPTGGLVGGDHLRTEIALGPGSHVCLTTPSATKVYRTLGRAAVQDTTIHVGDGAVLEYLPDHVILYPGSALRQTLSIEMGRASRAIIYDAFAMGRLARGERWTFREIVSQVTVTCQGRPIFLDRIRLVPKATPGLSGLGGMEDFGYFATLALLTGDPSNQEIIARPIERELKGLSGVHHGISLLSRGGCLIRLLAASAYNLQDAMRALWTQARRLLLGLPPLDLRKF